MHRRLVKVTVIRYHQERYKLCYVFHTSNEWYLNSLMREITHKNTGKTVAVYKKICAKVASIRFNFHKKCVEKARQGVIFDRQ